jgi:hypothetical protein
MARTLRLEPIAKINAQMRDGELVAFNVGADGLIYLVLARRPLDYRIERNRFSFPKTIPDEPQSYRVIAMDGNDLQYDVEIPELRFNVHDVQPLPTNELLLACHRSYYRGRGDFDKNGRVYTRDGLFVRDFLLGDGINAVQTTSEGVTWTSYMDEGVLGNFGWNDPVGASGLVAWDSQGKKLYEFEPRSGLDSMVDCYALNVESHANVWCYYYTRFPLVHLRRGRIEEFWNIPVRGSHAFAVSKGLALFSGGYDTVALFHLFELQPNATVKELASIQVEDENGLAINASWITARGRSIYMLNDTRLYRLDVEMAA